MRKSIILRGLAVLVVAFYLVPGCGKKEKDGPSQPDTTPPKVSSVSATSSNSVKVIFNEKVEEASAESDTNYEITGLSVVNAILQVDEKIVILTTTTQDSSMTYNITIRNVMDLSANPMTDTTLTFKGKSIAEEIHISAFIGRITEELVYTASVIVMRGTNNVDDATVSIDGILFQYMGSGIYTPPGNTMNLTPGQSYDLLITTPQNDYVTGTVEMVYPVSIASPSEGQIFLVGQEIPVIWSYQSGHTPDWGWLTLGEKNSYFHMISGGETSHTIPDSAIVESDPDASIWIIVENDGTLTGAGIGSFYVAYDLDLVNIVIQD
jgi:hypothetical protein